MKNRLIVGICVLGSTFVLAAVGQEENQSQKTDAALPPAASAPDSSTSQDSNSTE
jgi:hypothetical protein